jgi:hypothetical protein
MKRHDFATDILALEKYSKGTWRDSTSADNSHRHFITVVRIQGSHLLCFEAFLNTPQSLHVRDDLICYLSEQSGGLGSVGLQG